VDFMREENLKIAKQAHKEIIAVKEKFEKLCEFGMCWDECLWVNEDFFNYSDLKYEKESE
jgi:hypothetical protein